MSRSLSTHTVIALLVKKDYSKHQIRTKLSRRFPHDPNIETIIEQCETMGYLNDERFTELRIRYLSGQGKGPQYIQHDLKQKGISHEMIAKHLTIIDNSWLNIAELALRKRFRNRVPSTPKEYLQQVRFLQQRGFIQQHINALLRLTQHKWPPDDDN